MLEPCEGLPLASEQRLRDAAVARNRHPLERHLLVEFAIVALGQIDHGHAAARQLAHDAKRSDDIVDFEFALRKGGGERATREAPLSAPPVRSRSRSMFTRGLCRQPVARARPFALHGARRQRQRGGVSSVAQAGEKAAGDTAACCGCSSSVGTADRRSQQFSASRVSAISISSS